MSLRDVEIRHLQALQAVASEGSFGRAAERLGFSQSAVSQQIAALERVTGMPVFDRPGGPRPVELTPVGRLLLEHADAVLGRLRQAEDDLERLRSGEGGRLVIGSFQSVSVQILPVVLGRIRAELPGVVIRCVEGDDNEELVGRLATGEFDLTFLVGDTDAEGLDIVDLMVDPFVLISPAGSAASPVTNSELGQSQLIGQQPNSCQYLVDLALRQRGVEPDYVFRSNDNGAVQAMVRAGMGSAVMPFLAIDPDDPGIVVRSVVPPIAPRHIRIARRTGRTLVPAADRFVEIARDVCAELAARSAVAA